MERPNENLRVGERVRYMPQVYGNDFVGIVIRVYMDGIYRRVDVEYRTLQDGPSKLAKGYCEGYWYRLEEYNPIEVY